MERIALESTEWKIIWNGTIPRAAVSVNAAYGNMGDIRNLRIKRNWQLCGRGAGRVYNFVGAFCSYERRRGSLRRGGGGGPALEFGPRGAGTDIKGWTDAEQSIFGERVPASLPKLLRLPACRSVCSAAAMLYVLSTIKNGISANMSPSLLWVPIPQSLVPEISLPVMQPSNLLCFPPTHMFVELNAKNKDRLLSSGYSPPKLSLQQLDTCGSGIAARTFKFSKSMWINFSFIRVSIGLGIERLANSSERFNASTWGPTDCLGYALPVRYKDTGRLKIDEAAAVLEVLYSPTDFTRQLMPWTSSGRIETTPSWMLVTMRAREAPSHLQSLGANPVGAMHKLKGMKRYRAGYSDLTTFDYLTAQQYETGAGARSREERALALIMTPEVSDFRCPGAVQLLSPEGLHTTAIYITEVASRAVRVGSQCPAYTILITDFQDFQGLQYS
ncbi:hypothetical protein B0H13DRAFT_1889913 [Mycena leptocephala]|nr:hypothetical protein B0H13DRAFT_1889913 [Mycena leptocephala]